MIKARSARVRERGGSLGAVCARLEGSRDRLRRVEHGSLALVRSMPRRLLRLTLEILIVLVIALFELDTLRRRAASALVTRPR